MLLLRFLTLEATSTNTVSVLILSVVPQSGSTGIQYYLPRFPSEASNSWALSFSQNASRFLSVSVWSKDVQVPNVRSFMTTHTFCWSQGARESLCQSDTKSYRALESPRPWVR